MAITNEDKALVSIVFYSKKVKNLMKTYGTKLYVFLHLKQGFSTYTKSFEHRLYFCHTFSFQQKQFHYLETLARPYKIALLKSN